MLQMISRAAIALTLLSLTSGCAAGLAAASLGGSMLAVNTLGNQGAKAGDEIARMNCSQLRAEYHRTKGATINPVKSTRHALTLDALRERGCRRP